MWCEAPSQVYESERCQDERAKEWLGTRVEFRLLGEEAATCLDLISVVSV